MNESKGFICMKHFKLKVSFIYIYYIYIYN